ncbi:unnamed protein product [Symbiodinium sp. KB8]|nr:unnamed protein product [Symbiodinium sp. KB8]
MLCFAHGGPSDTCSLPRAEPEDFEFIGEDGHPSGNGRLMDFSELGSGLSFDASLTPFRLQAVIVATGAVCRSGAGWVLYFYVLRFMMPGAWSRCSLRFADCGVRERSAQTASA